MTRLVKITDHETRAKNRIITQFRDKENIEGLISVFAKRIQGLEDSLDGFYGGRLNIANAAGRQLDNIGRLIGQSRLGYSDSFYRVLLFSRIGINTSRGIIPDIINIAGISTTIREEMQSFMRQRVTIIARDTENSYRYSPSEDEGKLMFQIGEDGDFFGDLESGTMNGIEITDSVDLLLSGRNWRRIGLASVPEYPPVGQLFQFDFVKNHPPANIQFFNLENGEVAIGTDGFFPDNLRNFLFDRLTGIVLAGVRLDYICFYTPSDQGFAFAGDDTGGGFGEMITDDTPFAFAGEGSGDGFGDLKDPLAGGILTV